MNRLPEDSIRTIRKLFPVEQISFDDIDKFKKYRVDTYCIPYNIAQCKDSWAYLIDTIKKDDNERLYQIIKDVANLNDIMYICEAGTHGHSLFDIAILFDAKKCFNMLLVSGASPDVRDRDQRTPLFTAVKCQNLYFVEELIRYKADVNLQDNRKETPLLHCGYFGTPDIYDILVKEGADPEYYIKKMTSKKNKTYYIKFDTLAAAIATNNQEMIDHLTRGVL